MKVASVTLTVSTHGPTIEEQLEAMQTQLLIDKGIRAAEKFDRQMREIERRTQEAREWLNGTPKDPAP